MAFPGTFLPPKKTAHRDVLIPRLLSGTMCLRHLSVSTAVFRTTLQRPLHIFQRIRIVQRREIARVTALREHEQRAAQQFARARFRQRVARVRPQAAPGALDVEPQRIFLGLRFPGCARRAYPGYSFRCVFEGHRHLKPAMAHDAFGLCALLDCWAARCACSGRWSQLPNSGPRCNALFTSSNAFGSSSVDRSPGSPPCASASSERRSSLPERVFGNALTM